MGLSFEVRAVRMRKGSTRADAGLPTNSSVNGTHEAYGSGSKPLPGPKSKVLLRERKKLSPKTNPYGGLGLSFR